MAKDARGHGSEKRGVNYLEPNDPRGAGARKRYAARISR
jgi:hypothetical protein